MKEKLLQDLAAKLSDLLDRPEEWSVERHTLNHVNGVRLWICNGKESFGVHTPEDFKFSDEIKDLLWPKIEAIIGGYEEMIAARDAAKVQLVIDALEPKRQEVPA